MAPLVSVIIPTYRRTKSLKEALRSVCQQDYSPIEIIVVDDNGSIEWNTQVAQIVREAQAFSRSTHTLTLLSNPRNLGVAKSRNIGIHASNGQFVTFLDDDDTYLPTKISMQLTGMLKANADYSLMDLDLFNERDQLVEHKSHPLLRCISGKEEMIRLHLLYHLTGTDALMFRKEYLMEIGCFDGIDIGDEFYLMMKAIENDGQFIYLPHSLVRARVHSDGSGLSAGPRKLQGQQQLFSFKRQYFAALPRKDIRSIKARHHAVLAYVHWRLRQPLHFFIEAMQAFWASPRSCIQMLLHRKQW